MTNAQQKILIVDDEQALLEAMRPFLMRSGYAVDTAADGEAALDWLQESSADLVILDVLMPGIDGREVLRRMRAQEIWTPVILLTQVGDAAERAIALTEGADDYLNKPYDPHELIARIGAILRRTQLGQATLATQEVLVAKALRFDRSARIATFNGKRLTLTPRALALLEYFLLHPGELLTRERLLDAVWGWSFATGTRSVDARIAELRKALAEEGAGPEYIETVPAEGYRFTDSTQAGEF